MAIVSNKGYDAVQVLCSRFFAPYVTEYYGVREDLRKKPAPDMLIAAMEKLGSEKSDCVMIGDGEPDIAMARAAGIDAVRTINPWTKHGKRKLGFPPVILRIDIIGYRQNKFIAGFQWIGFQ